MATSSFLPCVFSNHYRGRGWHSGQPRLMESLERRDLLSVDFASSLPSSTGQTFVVDNWDYDVTQNDLGFNDFFGNTGATESIPGSTSLNLSPVSNGSDGGSLRFAFDFMGQKEKEFSGYFASLFGLTDTLVSLDGSGEQPDASTRFPGYALNTSDIFGAFSPLPSRSVELLKFDVRLESPEPVTLKIELKDEYGFDVFTRRVIANNGGNWQTFWLAIPSSFTNSVSGNGDPSAFDWTQVDVFSLLVERQNVGDGVVNPNAGALLFDNLALMDIDGLYPDLAAIQDPATGQLDAAYEEAFLDYVRATSFLYFMDFASTDSRTGGIIQDRSTFADLMTVGGVGFQLSAYVSGAEQGYISYDEAAVKVRDVLGALADNPQGPDRVGTIGHEGFFYHFLGIDGLRKQNFDFTATELDESLNTVELSSIDTALAIAGVVTVGQYFTGDSAIEAEIRSLAEEIYGRVNWKFMLYNNPADPDDIQNNQFYLGWKPNEQRADDSGRFGRFKLDDAAGQGQYASKLVNGIERPATLDFYTDEAILIALLALGSPNPDHRVGREAWDALERVGDPFVKTFPGALFTYQFGSVWLDTEKLGADNHPERPMDFFENTKAAIQATRQYVATNPKDRATWLAPSGDALWGLTAAEDPEDRYHAHAAPDAALAEDGGFVEAESQVLEAESAMGAGQLTVRTNASNQLAVQLDAGEQRLFSFTTEAANTHNVLVRYSNDNFGPLETIAVEIDGISIGSFEAQDTGDFGLGWNEFLFGSPNSPIHLEAGPHDLVLTVSGGDGFGVEIDQIVIEGDSLLRPIEVGVTTNYGVGSSIVHAPEAAIEGLWASTQVDLNGDGVKELLNPRFGFADAFTLDIADAHVPGSLSKVLPERSSSGPWANFTGFSIDHGPMLLMIDNYLEDQFIPSLFMSHPMIATALDSLFEDQAEPAEVEILHDQRFPLNLAAQGTFRLAVLSTPELDAGLIDVRTVEFAGAHVRRSQLRDINRDGKQDLILQFHLRDTELLDLYRDALLTDLQDGRLDAVVHDVSAELSGHTIDGRRFESSLDLSVYEISEILALIRRMRDFNRS